MYLFLIIFTFFYTFQNMGKSYISKNHFHKHDRSNSVLHKTFSEDQVYRILVVFLTRNYIGL